MTFCWQNWHDEIDKVTAACYTYRKLYGPVVESLSLVSGGCGPIPHIVMNHKTASARLIT